MNKSVIFYLDRSDTVQVIDSGSLSHTDDLSLIMNIAVAVIRAGYDGVVIDQHRMTNGRYFQALNTNIATPEGRILTDLCKMDPAALPTPKAVLSKIRQAYQHGEGAT
jgi:hypothetical protein